MIPDPTLRADLMAYLAANARDGKRVILRTPDYRPMCGHVSPLTGERCGADCNDGQRYCFDHRREYEEKRKPAKFSDVWFHDDTKQILRAYRFLRRRANQVAA